MPRPASSRSPVAARVWQRMLSGRRLDLLDPSPMDVELDDIAHGLARVARWNGQTTGAYAFSVAQHSCVVASLVKTLKPAVTAKMELMALLHDAPEYVVGDMISPFKAVLGDDYKSVEARLERAIHLRFGLPAVTPASLKKLIKKADHICAWFEATQLAGFTPDEADAFFGAPPDGIALTLDPLGPNDAKAEFVDAFDRLISAIDAAGPAP